jgi:predicted RNA binding protein with dsRBD fold (UPF0201 family)
MSITRKLTAAQWVATNPTLRAGERGIEKDTKKEKIGDGVTPWNNLSYQFNKVSADANYVRFVDENNKPLSGKHVVIKVNSTTLDILDIIAEA